MVGKGCDVFAPILPWICSKRAGGQAVTQIKAMKGYQNLHSLKLTANASPKKIRPGPNFGNESSEPTNWNFQAAELAVSFRGGGNISSLGMKRKTVCFNHRNSQHARPWFSSRSLRQSRPGQSFAIRSRFWGRLRNLDRRSYYSLSNYPCMVYISYILHLTSFYRKCR